MSIPPQAKLALALVALPILWRVSGYLIRRVLIRKLTILNDVKNIGKPRAGGQRVKGNAVICGGGIAGLWAARICSDHFENVIVIDSEAWIFTDEGVSAVCDEKGNMGPDGRDRTRVMQYGAIHIYQPLSLEALRTLFPEFDEEMGRRDVRIKAAEFNIFISGGQLNGPDPADYPSGVCPQAFFATRETYEKTLRQFVRRQSNIKWVTGTVNGLNLASDDLEQVESVAIRKPDGSEENIPTALFIDCSGNSQPGFKWIKRAYEKAREANPRKYATIPRGKQPLDKIRSKYDIQGHARTFCFSVTPSMAERMAIPGGYADAGWLLTSLPEAKWDNRCIVMTKYEGNRIRFGAMGWGKPPLPQTPADIPDYLRSVKCKAPFQDWIYDTIDILQEDEAYTIEDYKIPACSYIRYDIAAYVPRNFVAFGDSVMCANPIWGQGCTKATIGAIVLDTVLRRSSSASLPSNFSATFFKEHHLKVSGVWDGTKPADYGFKTTIPAEGETLESEWIMTRFAQYLLRLAVNDKKIEQTVWKVRMFLAPPTDLMNPSLLRKMVTLVVKDRLGFSE